MRKRIFAALFIVVTAASSRAQADRDRDLSGTWRLNDSRSDIRDPIAPLDKSIEVRQTATSLTVSAGGRTLVYPLDRRTEKTRLGDTSYSTVTKWEGDALLVNIIVSGPRDYSLFERWERSRDGRTLTVTRTITTPSSGESESTLLYENPAVVSETRAPEPKLPQPAIESRLAPSNPPPALSRRETPAAQRSGDEYVVAAGSRILLRLTNSVNTKRSAAGDRVYLETAVPVFVNGRLVIPQGSYVTGTIIESQRAGRVKGKSSLNLQFETLTLRSGISRDLRSRPGSVDAGGSLDRTEGRINGESNKGGDARTVATTGAAGAGLGSIIGLGAGHAGLGAGIGGAAGAAAGLAGILGSRGPDVVLKPGTTMELVLDHELHYSAADLAAIY